MYNFVLNFILNLLLCLLNSDILQLFVCPSVFFQSFAFLQCWLLSFLKFIKISDTGDRWTWTQAREQPLSLNRMSGEQMESYTSLIMFSLNPNRTTTTGVKTPKMATRSLAMMSTKDPAPKLQLKSHLPARISQIAGTMDTKLQAKMERMTITPISCHNITVDKRAAKTAIWDDKNRTVAAANRPETEGVSPDISGDDSKPAKDHNSRAKEGATNAVIGTKCRFFLKIYRFRFLIFI